MTHSIATLAELLGLPYQGDGDRLLLKVSKCDAADAVSLVFLESRER